VVIAAIPAFIILGLIGAVSGDLLVLALRLTYLEE